MNQGAWKRFWTWCQSTMGAGWIHLSTYNIMNVYGLEHVEAASRERPLLLVANHRSFFDMYAVSTVLFRETSWRKQLFFPVRGRFFLPIAGRTAGESDHGLVVHVSAVLRRRRSANSGEAGF
jgi:1-acyl-sn-glycerol-3-phosphate acyltransferase